MPDPHFDDPHLSDPHLNDPHLDSSAASTTTLTADSGSFAYTGSAASLEHGRLLVAEPDSFDFAGTDATLSIGNRTITAESGSFVVTGTPANLHGDETPYAIASAIGSGIAWEVGDVRTPILQSV